MTRRLPLWLLTVVLVCAPAAAHAEGSEGLQRDLARALIFAETGRYVDALILLRRAHQADPTRLDLLLRIAVLEMRTGDDDLAERDLQQILARDPKYVDALRELGALYILKKRPADAEGHLQKAAALAPKDGATRYYLGLALHALGRVTESRAALMAAAQMAPELRTQAGYYLGLSWLLVHNGIKAREALEYAVRANTDPEFVTLAKRTLSEIGTRLGKTPKSWDLFVSIGAVYDSNVALMPDLSKDLPLPPGVTLIGADSSVTTAAAARLFAEVAFEVRPISGANTLGIGGSFYQSKHLPEQVEGAFDPPSFDMTSFSAYLYYALASKIRDMPFRLELTGGYSEIVLDIFRDPRHYLQNPWLRSSVALTTGSWAATRLSYRLSVENYITGNPEGSVDDRDGFEHLVTLEQFFFPSSWFNLRLSAYVGTFGADGDQWDAVLWGASVDSQIKIFRVLGLWVGIDYLHRDFIHSKYTLISPDLQTRDVQRTDDRFAAFGRFQIDLHPVSIGVLYTFMQNISSAKQLFSYTRHIAGVEASFRY